jgi:hypothetical protein
MYPIELFCFLVGVALVCMILASIARDARKALAILAMVILICEGGLLGLWIFISMQFHGLGNFAPIVALLIMATMICGVWSGYLISASPKGGINEEIMRTSHSDKVRCLGCGADIDSNQEACQKCGWTWK